MTDPAERGRGGRGAAASPPDPDAALAERLAAVIRDVADFPRAGILFKDITTLLRDAGAFRAAVDRMADDYRGARIDEVVGIESRGFVLGGALAHVLGAGFVPVRKAGRLPAETLSLSYTLEYGEATLEIHADALTPGQRVLIVDDLLATGGTAAATIDLVRRLRAEPVGAVFLAELTFLGGAARLGGLAHRSLVTY